MSLNEYLDLFRNALEKFEKYGYADIVEIKQEIRANKQAILIAKVVLIDNSNLYIREYIDAKYGIDRVSYAYQYQNSADQLIFRYDNAVHRPALGFKDHKHSNDGKIYEAALPDIFDLVDEILTHL